MTIINNKGITLIGLIITIIIMLILVGVTVNVSLKDGGLIKQAQISKDEHITAGEKEEIQMF